MRETGEARWEEPNVSWQEHSDNDLISQLKAHLCASQLFKETGPAQSLIYFL